ncbi:MAG: NADH-quinone oxidoreductase subunit L, partial [Mycolicibacterium sp.]
VVNPDGAHAHHVVPVWVMSAITLSVVLIGVAVAYRAYSTRAVPQTAPADVSALTRAARRDLYGDAFNEAVFMRPGQQLTKELVRVDDHVIEGVGGGLATLVSRCSEALRRLQTGFARSYALTILAGAALMVAAVLLTGVWR